MRSSLIGKIEKAKRYAQEPGRVTLSSFTADFHGDNADHVISYAEGKWQCGCHFFSQWGICSHSMALQQMLAGVLPKEALASAMEPQPEEKVTVLREISREQAKQEVQQLFSSRRTLYYSDIAKELSLDLELVVDICRELEENGEVKVDESAL